jgi:hypothetical protein
MQAILKIETCRLSKGTFRSSVLSPNTHTNNWFDSTTYWTDRRPDAPTDGWTSPVMTIPLSSNGLRGKTCIKPCNTDTWWTNGPQAINS